MLHIDRGLQPTIHVGTKKPSNALLTMKPLHAFTLLLISAATAVAQTNTFPASGNVGIGTTSPVSLLNLYQASTPALTLTDATIGNTYGGAVRGYGLPGFGGSLDLGALDGGVFNQAIQIYPQSFYITFLTNAGSNGSTAERMRITSSGNVGIGTTEPTQKLHVNGGILRVSGGGASASGKGEINLDSGTQYDGFQIRQDGADGVNSWSVKAVENLPLSFGTGNIKRVTIDTAGNVGVGTTSPQTKFVVSNAGTMGLEISPTSLSNDVLIQSYDRNTSIYKGIRFDASNLSFFTAGASLAFAIAPSGNVGIGTTNPTEKLSVNGRIRAKEVIVETTGWSDHVFAQGYKLAPLSEVEQHIQQQGHLPGVPSATEVAEKGVSVGDMQAVLLAKVEELTLHLIAQEKELARLRETEKELAALRVQVQQLQQGK